VEVLLFFDWFRPWHAIRKEAAKYASGNLRKLLSTLKSKRDATLAELRSVLSDTGTMLAMKLIQHCTQDRITRSGARDFLTLYSVPVSTFAESQVVARSLAARLISNVELEAAKNALSVSPDHWKNFVAEYSAAFVRFATRRALDDLCAATSSMYGDRVIIAIADGEAYSLNGRAGHHDMVKFCVVGAGADRDARIESACRLWKKRADAGYSYERNI
jgi:hypothetical protein